MSALLTSDAPRWLVLVLLAVVATSYIACGVLSLAGRTARRTDTRTPARPRARQEITS